ncbi:MAG: pyridoxamine 5'-phosphate oxidase family protein [Pyrinomonadaceae bacterium]|nr:pyridoxamine 5'-phosphate oxidase family protein [Pyrinomonadaceae bacterium]
MSDAECRKALEQAGFGRLACARDNRPYVVPIYFAFDGRHVYSFTTLGQKIEWARSNPFVCLEIDERTSHDKWMSVIVFGRYEELPDEPQFEAARFKAHELLKKRAMWWEPAYMSTAHRDSPHSFTPIFYRIRIERMTGHRATPDAPGANGKVVIPSTAKESWWGSLMRCMRLAN